MFEISLENNTIIEDQLGYEVTGMISPVFHNDGDVDVKIQNQIIAPGDRFEAQFPGMVLRGKINIEFQPAPGSVKSLVIVHYGRYVAPYVHPATGAKLTTTQKTAIMAHNSNCN